MPLEFEPSSLFSIDMCENFGRERSSGNMKMIELEDSLLMRDGEVTVYSLHKGKKENLKQYKKKWRGKFGLDS